MEKQDLVCLIDFDENGPVWDEVERAITIPTFRKKCGPRYILEKGATASEFLDFVFRKEMVNLLVTETNRYA